MNHSFPAFILSRWVLPGLACLVLAGEATASWPQFRGPNGQGVSQASPPPAQFGHTSHRLWSTSLPPGHSSPVWQGNRIVLTAFEDGKLLTIGLDTATGNECWRRVAPAVDLEKVHAFSSPATPTPLAADGRFVVYFGSFGLLGYDADGEELWRHPLPTPRSQYGTSSSPVRVGDTAVLVLDSDDRASRIIAINLADGSLAWETPRPLATAGWSTPVLWEHAHGSEIVVLGARRLMAYASGTGADAWWLDGYSPETIGVPVIGDGLLFVSSSGLAGPPTEGFKSMNWEEMLPLDRNRDGLVQREEIPENFRFTLRPELPEDHPGRHLPVPFHRLFGNVDGNQDGALSEEEFQTFINQWGARAKPSLRAIRPGGRGDITTSHVAWESDRGIPEIPSPLYHRGRLYLVRDGGFITCVRAATGELLYQERVGAPGSYSASPVAAGNHVYLASHNGVVICLAADTDELETLARNELGEKIWATPALGDGVIYVRTEGRLHAFGAVATPLP
jgi:outer membrane protein assembly factor BamB